jgi:Holliday junction resolvase RusA-like endonuclease
MSFREELTFTVEGEPVAKQRPRHVRGIVYTPKKTMDREKIIAKLAKSAVSQSDWTKAEKGEPLHVEAEFGFKMPESWSKKKRAEMEQSSCCKTPDIDNICKLYLDALNKAETVWHDDAQVVSLVCEKVWTEKPYTIITVVKL